MSLAFQTANVTFPTTRDKMQTLNGQATFNTNVKLADAAIKGFNIQFVGSDHNFYLGEVNVREVKFSGNLVKFIVDLGLRDFSGDWDNNYSGWVNVLVTADVE